LVGRLAGNVEIAEMAIQEELIKYGHITEVCAILQLQGIESKVIASIDNIHVRDIIQLQGTSRLFYVLDSKSTEQDGWTEITIKELAVKKVKLYTDIPGLKAVKI
jgi:hypothetical protein